MESGCTKSLLVVEIWDYDECWNRKSYKRRRRKIIHFFKIEKCIHQSFVKKKKNYIKKTYPAISVSGANAYGAGI